ncbi:hypothetical protein KI387_000641, partial [Taxus chinensis]
MRKKRGSRRKIGRSRKNHENWLSPAQGRLRDVWDRKAQTGRFGRNQHKQSETQQGQMGQ